MNIYFIGMALSMVIYIILGFAISKRIRTADDFYVAGRNAPTILIIGSLVASYCSTGLFMGDAGEAFGGFYAPVLITVTMQVAGYVLGSVFFGKYLRRSRVSTIPEFFEKRFCSRKIRVLASLTGLIIYLVYMLSIMQGIGTLMNFVTGVNYNLCILLALITFTILTATSGSKGVLITDTIMFGIFTIAAILSAFVIVGKGGGWWNTLREVTAQDVDVFSWHGDLGHLYPTGAENMIWAAMTGVTWVAVCMVGPWQSSRYLMAKNEHTVVRSSTVSAFLLFLLEFLMLTVGAFIRKFNPDIPSASYAMIWGGVNLLPTLLGVIMLTGVLAAGISSATTFLSLISASVAKDLFAIKDAGKSVKVGKIVIAVSSAIILLLAILNPPNIYIIMLLSGTVVVCAWFPICVVSIWSKRVTKTGAFCGMLFGFLGCSIMKIVPAVMNISVPIYFDSFFVGIVLNIAGLVVGSLVTKVSGEEKAARAELMITPASELNERDISVTKKYLWFYVFSGALVLLILLLFWALPYVKALK